jgi:hypothetical protein
VAVDHLIEEPAHGRLVGDVGRDGVECTGHAASPISDRNERVLPAPGEQHSPPRAGQPMRNRRADTASRSGDDSDLWHLVPLSVHPCALRRP